MWHVCVLNFAAFLYIVWPSSATAGWLQGVQGSRWLGQTVTYPAEETGQPTMRAHIDTRGENHTAKVFRGMNGSADEEIRCSSWHELIGAEGVNEFQPSMCRICVALVTLIMTVAMLKAMTSFQWEKNKLGGVAGEGGGSLAQLYICRIPNDSDTVTFNLCQGNKDATLIHPFNSLAGR